MDHGRGPWPENGLSDVDPESPAAATAPPASATGESAEAPRPVGAHEAASAPPASAPAPEVPDPIGEALEGALSAWRGDRDRAALRRRLLALAIDLE